jgi:hypothetical protein
MWVDWVTTLGSYVELIFSQPAFQLEKINSTYMESLLENDSHVNGGVKVEMV